LKDLVRVHEELRHGVRALHAEEHVLAHGQLVDQHERLLQSGEDRLPGEPGRGRSRELKQALDDPVEPRDLLEDQVRELAPRVPAFQAPLENLRRGSDAGERIPNLVRDLFAEGAMSAAFVPAFMRQLALGGKESAWRLGSHVINALLVATGILAIACCLPQTPENNIVKAQKLSLATAAGLWRLAEEVLEQLLMLQNGGLAHGDTELHNIIVCPAPLEPILIDFEASIRRDTVDQAVWETRCQRDLQPLLREAIYLQCVLGRQTSRLGELSWNHLAALFRSPDRFRRAIEMQAEV
jgi:hypothetical protein